MNIFPDSSILKIKAKNEGLLNQKGQVVWFTGLSGSGKTTIAKALYEQLSNNGFVATILDGDNVRTGLCNDLSFSIKDRKENIRRIAHTANLMADAGLIVLVSFITPTQEMRDLAVDIIGEDKYSLIFVNTSLETCINRDTKGLYKKALAGEITNFTGLDSPYDIPELPTAIVNTENLDVRDIAEELMQIIEDF